MNNKGFTLVEMVMVIVIVAIMTGIITIGLVSSTGRTNDDTLINTLADGLESSRFSAMSSKNGCSLTELRYHEGYGYTLRDFSYSEDPDVPGEMLTDNKVGNSKNILYLNIEDNTGNVVESYEISSLTIQYDKATGSFVTLELTTLDNPDGVALVVDDSKRLTITTEHFRKKCVLARNTGRVVVE